MTSPRSSAVDEYHWRPITAADLDAWVALFAAVEAVDQEGEHVSVEQLAEYLDDPHMDFPRGTVAVFDSAGLMVAYCGLMARSSADPEHRIWLQGAVHPEHRGRGLGGELLNWAKRASVPFHEQRFPGRPMSLFAHCAVKLPAALAMFERHGYRQTRWFNGMELDLAKDLAEGLPQAGRPDGVVFVPFGPERSADALRVRNDSFRDHWGSTETSQEAWTHRLTSAVFRPEFTYLAYEQVGGALGEPLALVLAEEYEARQRATGRRDLYIALVGTRRGARGRGLATALLTEILRRARAEGFDTASLGVDSDSPTGSTRVYARLGFRVTDTTVAQLLPVITGTGEAETS
ncbi:GNAT family N-acetyltransferase [Streptacidiphilus sp. P02-A3a]|uniref:GNAT family N-acetyltransferase n=1 Tax=Streptacidiphilus sp. P02-A3a TaxID=2704468 RepID=UPI0015FA2C6C|nr:GNAT family N-acetyltransferase [Streptacidiphilus sp. P02-A3a]QMU66982.1 GNAT family N-acetyltransferase [Streptacidiphilus sp. P02-A3a]